MSGSRQPNLPSELDRDKLTLHLHGNGSVHFLPQIRMWWLQQLPILLQPRCPLDLGSMSLSRVNGIRCTLQGARQSGLLLPGPHCPLHRYSIRRSRGYGKTLRQWFGPKQSWWRSRSSPHLPQQRLRHHCRLRRHRTCHCVSDGPEAETVCSSHISLPWEWQSVYAAGISPVGVASTTTSEPAPLIQCIAVSWL